MTFPSYSCSIFWNKKIRKNKIREKWNNFIIREYNIMYLNYVSFFCINAIISVTPYFALKVYQWYIDGLIHSPRFFISHFVHFLSSQLWEGAENWWQFNLNIESKGLSLSRDCGAVDSSSRRELNLKFNVECN